MVHTLAAFALALPPAPAAQQLERDVSVVSADVEGRALNRRVEIILGGELIAGQ